MHEELRKAPRSSSMRKPKFPQQHNLQQSGIRNEENSLCKAGNATENPVLLELGSVCMAETMQLLLR